MQKRFFEELPESWDTLKNSKLPICIYGMGDACVRLLEQFQQRGIKCSAIFASDDFVRGQEFLGYKVCTLAQLEERFGDFTVCCAFGSSLPDVMAHISDIAKAHTLIYPDLPIAGDMYFSKNEFLNRFNAAEKVYNRLADGQSRKAFIGIFAFKITGDISYLTPIFTNFDKAFEELIRPLDDEIYADLGAYTGDTAESFIETVGGKYKHILTFEPDKRSFRKCVKRLIRYNNITFMNACAWSCDTQLCFSQSAGRQSQILDDGTAIAARSLDSVLGGKKCTIIKYDVEGAEREVLNGCEQTIKRYFPRLAVSAYHKPFDLIDIPNQILEMNPEYKIYVRQPCYFPAWDSMIYAVK